MPSIRATNINDTSARAVIEGLLFTADYYDLFTVELWDATETTFYYDQSWIDSSGVNNYTYIDFSGLNTGTTYILKGFTKSGGNQRTFIGRTSFTTTSPLPAPGGVGTVSVTPGETNLSLSWNAATNAQWYDVTVRVGSSTGTIAYTNNSIYGTSVNVTGLSSDTTYWIEVKAGNSTDNGAASVTTATTTSPTPVRPQNWTWQSLVSSQQTDPNLVYQSTIPLNLVDASDWNNFTAKINEFRNYKLGPGNQYTFTSVSSGQGFSDSIYQEAVNAISSMATVSQPSGFYSKLIALKDALNSI